MKQVGSIWAKTSKETKKVGCSVFFWILVVIVIWAAIARKSSDSGSLNDESVANGSSYEEPVVDEGKPTPHKEEKPEEEKIPTKDFVCLPKLNEDQLNNWVYAERSKFGDYIVKMPLHYATRRGITSLKNLLFQIGEKVPSDAYMIVDELQEENEPSIIVTIPLIHLSDAFEHNKQKKLEYIARYVNHRIASSVKELDDEQLNKGAYFSIKIDSNGTMECDIDIGMDGKNDSSVEWDMTSSQLELGE